MSYVNGLSIPDAPYSTQQSIRTPYGVLTNPVGPVVAYVGTDYSTMPQDIREKLVPTLQAAISRARTDGNSVIYILPGHTENISTADYLSGLKAGTKIIGLGEGRDRGTFTWTTATSTVLVTVANVTIQNLILNMEPGAGTINVAAPITVSNVGFRMIGCDCRVATDANNKTTIAITTTAAADYLQLISNRFFGATAGEVTTVVRLVGADFACLIGNYIEAATSATAIGVVQFLTTASTSVYFEENIFINNKAASSQAVTGLASVSGVCKRDFHCILDNLTTGVVTPASLRFQDCRVSNVAGEAGMIMTVVST